MNVTIKPSVASGEINAPPSKSCAHRLLICAALAKGKSVIENIGTNDDILATISCLKELGAKIEIDGNKAVVCGIENNSKKETVKLFCNESGSTLRFLIPLSLIISNTATFSGSDRLLERPQSVYEELFSNMGCYLKKEGKTLVAGGELKSGTYKISGDVSSQFLTGLLFAFPLLEGDSEIILTTPLQSSPYVDITIDVLSKFGVDIKKSEEGFYIKGKQAYLPQKLSVEGDWSNSAFLEAFNIIGGNVTLKGMNEESYQGDKVYRKFFRELKDGTPTLDITDCPDLGPVLISCAVLCNGATLTGTKRLKIKESDRGIAMQTELSKFGVDIIVNEDEIIIPKTKIKAPNENLNCHNDHRIAMSLAILCSKVGGTLENAQCVNKSYPEFFDNIKTLGIQI
ncbi:MAG: 3-phosphoshikimate 1-carboxyvinyltransferase [Acutalibacteraceae bacterium]|nr:3-phosphoshikimate 1-carboxyvinyltransferase [Acutalibacteraceae bacterium]